MAGRKGYSRAQIALHWIVAVILVPQVLLEDGIKHAFRAAMRGEAAEQTAMAAFHVYAGILILALVLWRLTLRAWRGVPQAPAGGGALLELLARAVHLLLYAVLLLLPATGLAAWFGLSEPAGELHELMKPVLLILVGLHVAGALWHQFVLRDGLMGRMRSPG